METTAFYRDTALFIIGSLWEKRRQSESTGTFNISVATPGCNINSMQDYASIQGKKVIIVTGVVQDASRTCPIWSISGYHHDTYHGYCLTESNIIRILTLLA